MTKFATKEAGNTFVHLFNGQLRVLGKQNDWLYNVELDLLDDRVTGNNWRYENLEAHRAKFAGQPLLIAYTMGGKKIGDGHNMRVVRGRDGKEYASFTDADSERIIGSLSDNEQDIRLEVRDGHKWIVGKGTIWTWYAKEAVEKIASQGRMNISIETLVHENRMDGDVEVEESYTILGATILGDDVPPAVKGAHIRPLSQRDAEFRDLKLRAASYIQHKPEADPKKTPAANIHKGVRPKMNAKQVKNMEKLFPNDRVIGISEDGLTVALCSKADGEVHGYYFDKDEQDVVLQSHMLSAKGKLTVELEGDHGTMELALDSYFGPVVNELAETKEALAKETKARENAEAELNTMKANEQKRRKQAAKDAIKRELSEINATLNADEKIDEKVLEEVEEEIDNGEYDNVTNKEGEWCGAERACAAVKAKCMDIRKQFRAESIARKQEVYAWGNMRGNDNEDTVFGALK